MKHSSRKPGKTKKPPQKRVTQKPLAIKKTTSPHSKPVKKPITKQKVASPKPVQKKPTFWQSLLETAKNDPILTLLIASIAITLIVLAFQSFGPQKNKPVDPYATLSPPPATQSNQNIHLPPDRDTAHQESGNDSAVVSIVALADTASTRPDSLKPKGNRFSESLLVEPVFYVDGDMATGQELLFTIVDYNPNLNYVLELGNGITRKGKGSILYTYPKPGIFLAELTVYNQNNQSNSFSQVIEIARDSLQPDNIRNDEAVTAATPTPADTAVPVVENKPLPTKPEPTPPVKITKDTTPAKTTSTPPVPAPSPVEIAKPVPQDKPLQFAEKMPAFPGGKPALNKFIKRNMKYPELARENEKEGRVFVQFTVQPDGALTDIAVVRGIGYGCDEEALTLIKIMPNWVPGEHSGKKVAVRKTLPISFKF